MAEMTVSHLMQRLEKKSSMSTMVPIQAMAMFVFDLWILAMSMLLSDLEARLVVHSLFTIEAFLCGRKTERLIKFALLLRLVTSATARFLARKWVAADLLKNSRETNLGLRLMKLCSLAYLQVSLMRLENAVARAARGNARTEFIP
jgi:hypothetical protein